MSQVELSRRSGYSERVIRKAEAGGTLRFETIQDLATAMSVEGHSISLQDLAIGTSTIPDTDSVSWISRDDGSDASSSTVETWLTAGSD